MSNFTATPAYSTNSSILYIRGFFWFFHEIPSLRAMYYGTVLVHYRPSSNSYADKAYWSDPIVLFPCHLWTFVIVGDATWSWWTGCCERDMIAWSWPHSTPILSRLWTATAALGKSSFFSNYFAVIFPAKRKFLLLFMVRYGNDSALVYSVLFFIWKWRRRGVFLPTSSFGVFWFIWFLRFSKRISIVSFSVGWERRGRDRSFYLNVNWFSQIVVYYNLEISSDLLLFNTKSTV